MAHHLVFRLLYGLFCGVTIFVTYGRQSLCPVARVADCFNNLLPVITSSYKDKCHLYSQFRACFTHDGCTDRQSATIGSQVMFEMTGVRLPKEFLIAFLGNWRRACGGCLILDSPCSAAMKNYDLEHDSVFFDRLQKIVLGLHQGNLSSHLGCARLKHVLISWYKFRASLCPSYRSQCLCEEVKAQLERRCHFNCAALLGAGTRNRSRPGPIASVLLLVTFMCFFQGLLPSLL